MTKRLKIGRYGELIDRQLVDMERVEALLEEMAASGRAKSEPKAAGED